ARFYWKIPSLTDLIFIDQETVSIEYWYRMPNGKWDRSVFENISDGVKLESVNIEIPVSEIYSGVELPPAGESVDNRRMATAPLPYVTPEQYFELDNDPALPYEYLYGEILPVESGPVQHALICANVIGELKVRLSGGPCRVYAQSMRISLDKKG